MYLNRLSKNNCTCCHFFCCGLVQICSYFSLLLNITKIDLCHHFRAESNVAVTNLVFFFFFNTHVICGLFRIIVFPSTLFCKFPFLAMLHFRTFIVGKEVSVWWLNGICSVTCMVWSPTPSISLSLWQLNLFKSLPGVETLPNSGLAACPSKDDTLEASEERLL